MVMAHFLRFGHTHVLFDTKMNIPVLPNCFIKLQLALHFHCYYSKRNLLKD